MSDRRTTGLAAAAAAAALGGALALRRDLRALDGADARREAAIDTTFPSGTVVEVVASDGATIVTETVVSGPAAPGPTVLLVHGITSSRQDWGPVARRLVEQGCAVVGLDQRGHGDSTWGGDGYSPSRLGRDLTEAITALDLRDVVLVGHSMGGIAAMVFALEQAEISARVRSMVLVATTPRTPGLLRHLPGRLVEVALRRARHDLAVGRPALARALFGRHGSTKLVRAALASALRARPREVAECAVGIADYDIIDQLGSIAIDTRCVFGTLDVVTPARANRRIAATIPGATATEIPGAGHLLIWTHEAEIIEQILADRAGGTVGPTDRH